MNVLACFIFRERERIKRITRNAQKMTIIIKLNRIEILKKTKKKVTRQMMVKMVTLQTHNFTVPSPNHTLPAVSVGN